MWPRRWTDDHSRSLRRSGLGAFALLLLAACETPSPDTPAFSTTDSAGVSIVESARPVWQDGEGWSVLGEAEVRIGSAEGEEQYLLSEVTGVRLLSDGRIAVLDAGSDRLRIYDTEGRHLIDLGGPGDGPSEFRLPQYLGVVADTLFVYELDGSVSWFSPDGQFLRTTQVGDAPRTRVFGQAGYSGLGFLDMRASGEGLVRPPRQVWRIELEGTGADSLLSVPGVEELVSFPDPSRPSLQRHSPHVFGAFTSLAASDWIYVASSDAFSIQIYDTRGGLQRVVRRRFTPRRVRPADLNRWADQEIERRARSPDERAEMRRTARDLSTAASMPAFRWIVVDAQEHLWVEEWDGVGLSQGSFSVFNPAGAWLGNVDLPDGLSRFRWDSSMRIVEIGIDYILGVWTDQLGVEQVRLYRIEKE